MKSRQTWWLIFFAGAAIVAAALAWVSIVVLRLEQRELEARENARHQESLRLALWRMDSWLAPRLAREAARPYFEYLPYYPQERVYTRILNVIEPGEVLTPSPLLTFDSEFFPIHFQIGLGGSITSPQVPTGNHRDLAESTLVTAERLESKQGLLTQVAAIVDQQAIRDRVASATDRFEAMTCESEIPSPPPQIIAQNTQTLQIDQPPPNADPQQQMEWSKQEFANRAQSYSQVQQAMQMPEQKRGAAGKASAPLPDNGLQAAVGSDVIVEIGPLVPLWMSSDSSPSNQPSLIVVRQVQIDQTQWLQGFFVEWTNLRAAMLAQVSDLFTGAQLEPTDEQSALDGASGRVLATIPVSLITAAAPPAQSSAQLSGWMTPARATLTLTWLAVLGAIVAAGFTLQASIAYAQKRSRFASAVTHELRTPLTTFRMYSEMLADGMVRDESQKRTYLETLKTESSRLATLVENVLSYARLEDGRAASHPNQTTLGRLLDRLAPALHRRAAEAGMELIVEAPSSNEAPILIDAEPVGQILFNLVDNACKYATPNGERALNEGTFSGRACPPLPHQSRSSLSNVIHLNASMDNNNLTFTVRDHGPGIAPQHARAIFRPFDRGGHGPGDTIPGVGLGLALSRDLARALGGDLTLESPCGNGQDSGGACFRLTLPV